MGSAGFFVGLFGTACHVRLRKHPYLSHGHGSIAVSETEPNCSHYYYKIFFGTSVVRGAVHSRFLEKMDKLASGYILAFAAGAGSAVGLLMLIQQRSSGGGGSSSDSGAGSSAGVGSGSSGQMKKNNDNVTSAQNVMVQVRPQDTLLCCVPPL